MQFSNIPKVSTTLHSLIAKTDPSVESSTYAQACTYPRWVLSMNKEQEALHVNHTWDLFTLPPGKKPIGFKWVYKIKLKVDGSAKRFKARLVAKGFNQNWGIEYLVTFSPVVKMTTI